MISRTSLLQRTAASITLAAFATPRLLRAQSADKPIRLALASGGPRSLDPNTSAQGADNWVILQVYEPLVQPANGTFGTADADFLPILAETWTKSDDSKVWTFKLRQKVQFQKGYGDLTADDVVFSFERARSAGIATALYDNVDKIEATGPSEVVFTLKRGDPLFLAGVIFQPTSMIVSKKAMSEKGEDGAMDPIGTGPYQVESVDSKKGVFLTRTEDYWGEAAKTAKIEVLYISDATARTLGLASGDLDMIEAVRAPGWVQQMLQQNAKLIVDQTVPGSFNTLFFNLTKPPFDNLQVRQAIATLVDTNVVTQALAPIAAPIWTLSPPSYPTGWAHDDLPEELRYDYNVEKAKALLAEAGHPDGLTFTANISQREDYRSIMLILQEMMRPAGVDMQLNIMDHAAYHDANAQDANTLALLSQSLPPVPLDYFSRYLSTSAVVKADGSGGANYSHYGVAMPGVDDKIDAMRAAADYEEYVAIGREVELQVQRDLPVKSVATLSYAIIRSPAIDLGFEVKSGYARWRLDKAQRV